MVHKVHLVHHKNIINIAKSIKLSYLSRRTHSSCLSQVQCPTHEFQNISVDTAAFEMAFSTEHGRKTTYSDDVHKRIVWQQIAQEKPHQDIAKFFTC